MVKLGFGGSWDNNTCLLMGVNDQPTAVKTGFRGVATPFIWQAKALNRMVHDDFSFTSCVDWRLMQFRLFNCGA